MDRILVLQDKRLSTTETGVLVGCSQGWVMKVLKKHSLHGNGQKTKEYREKRSDIWVDIEKRLLDGITDEKIKNATMRAMKKAGLKRRHKKIKASVKMKIKKALKKTVRKFKNFLKKARQK